MGPHSMRDHIFFSKLYNKFWNECPLDPPFLYVNLKDKLTQYILPWSMKFVLKDDITNSSKKFFSIPVCSMRG